MKPYGWGMLLLLGACRGPGVDASTVEDDAEPDEDMPSTAASAPANPGDAGGAPTRGTALAETAAGKTASSAAAGGADDLGPGSEADESCGAERVTLDEIHSGRVRGTLAVSVGPLVASSQKFLVSEAKSGSCLWGGFAADPSRTGARSGLFLVSYGAPHAEGEACLPGSDGLPDDLAPGDSLEVTGRLDEYVPAACAGVAAALQLRIDVACPARRGAPLAPPEAAIIEPALADRLAAGTDAALLRDWAGALVQLEDVSAVQDGDDGDAVFPFGVLRLAETALEVHSRLYYFDLSLGGPRASAKAPRYRYPTSFQSVRGSVFLDYCNWVLAPRDRCLDLSPASEGCTIQAARP